ncbi:MAG: DUF1569 domain-containing protein [Pirellula staleyi]
MQRRELRFSTLSEVQADLKKLASTSYISVAKWDLSQVAEHLADWMTFPIEGYPKNPWIVSILIRVMRVTQGKSLYTKFVRNQRMATGQPTIPATVYPENASSEKSVERLLTALDRLSEFRGALQPSPLFGELSYDEVVALQLAHCAHHLSFLVPN